MSDKLKEARGDIVKVLKNLEEAIECYEDSALPLKEVDKFDKMPLLGVAGQWVAAFVSGIGIGIELIMKADIGYITITAGALIFAFATKLKYYKSLRR